MNYTPINPHAIEIRHMWKNDKKDLLFGLIIIISFIVALLT